MSLSEKLKTRTAPSSFNSPIDRWLATLPQEESEAAEEMLRDPIWTQRELRWAFRDEGFRVSTATISEWRIRNGVTR